MSEALGKTGKEGAEELARLINAYFTPMIRIVSECGAQVAKFAGDAMTIVIDKSAEKPAGKSSARTASLSVWDEAVLTALRCASLLQKQAAKSAAVSTQAGNFTLSIKIGIGCGSLTRLVVESPSVNFLTGIAPDAGVSGGTTSAREYFFAGDALEAATESESGAGKGDIVLSSHALRLLSPAFTDALRPALIALQERPAFRVQPESHLLKKLIAQKLSATDFNRSPFLPASVPMMKRLMLRLGAFLPPVLVRRLTATGERFLGEHRKVTVAFLAFEGGQYRTASDEKKINALYAAVRRSVHKYGGTLARVDAASGKTRFLCFFGTPTGYENNEERALRCVRELRFKQPGSTRAALPTLRAGITTGFLYCGNVGSLDRREFTVMGDSINLAARLMTAAVNLTASAKRMDGAGAGHILTDKPTHDATKLLFDFNALEPMQVKGKSEPVAVFEPVSERAAVRGKSTLSVLEKEAPASEDTFIGRASELGRLQTLVTSVSAGNGQIVSITGEAGVGKSKLAQRLVRFALDAGFEGYGGDAQSFGTAIAYLAWQDIFTGYFGLNGAPTKQISQLTRRVAAVNPALTERVPLLGSVTGLSIPDSSLTKNFDSKLRKESLFSLLVEVLRKESETKKLLFILEDVHWLDSLSIDLLNALARSLSDRPVLFALVYRPLETAPAFQVFSNPNHTKLELSEFTAEESVGFIRNKFGAIHIDESLQRLCASKSQGNAFYLGEILNYLADRRLLTLTDAQTLTLLSPVSEIEIPDTVSALVISRIDRLDEEEKLTLKVASVIGRTFQYTTLSGIHPSYIHPPASSGEGSRKKSSKALGKNKGAGKELKAQLASLEELDLTPLEKPEPELEYLFKHVITQQVAYESLLFSARRELHEKIARTIEQARKKNLADYYELLAYHYGLTTNDEKKLFYYEKAALKAQAAYANADAALYAQKAIDVIDKLLSE